MNSKQRFVSSFVYGLFLSFAVSAQKMRAVKLFLPQARDDWYTFIENAGRNNDSFGVFHFENNVLHVSGKRFGYIITQKSYSNFHLTLEFKWGEMKYPPRQNAKRDAGVLYYADLYSGDKIWPRSLEFQIQEGDCGDIWLTDHVSMIHADTITPKEPWHRVVKSTDAEKPNGQWNKVEVIVQNGQITHKLNGVVVNLGRDPSLTGGRIVLQSEGAEIYYRNIKLKEL